MTGAITRGRALRGDLSLWDGISSTSTRIDASGGTVTGVPVGDSVDVLQVYGSGSSRTKSAIDQAISAIGTVREATLSFAPGTWTITDNLTIPSNVAAFIPRGCCFDVSSGKTLTFSGPVTSESDSFSIGSGEVVFSVNSIVNGDVWIIQTEAEDIAGVTPTNYAYEPGDIRRYGAAGGSDDTVAIQSAFDVGGRVYIPDGTWIASALTWDASNGILHGPGTLKKKAGIDGQLILVTGDDNRFQINLDGTASAPTPGPANDIFRVQGGNGNKIRYSRINGSRGSGIRFDGGARNVAAFNDVLDVYQNSILVCNPGADDNLIEGNYCDGTETGNNIFLTADDGSADSGEFVYRNKIRGNTCKDAFDTGIESGYHAHYTEISGNHVSGSRNPPILLRDSYGCDVGYNIIRMAALASQSAESGAIAVVPHHGSAADDYKSRIHHNHCFGAMERAACYVGASGIDVDCNTFDDDITTVAANGSGLTGYGVTLAGASISNVRIFNNKIRHFERAIDFNTDGTAVTRTGIEAFDNKILECATAFNMFNVTAASCRIADNVLKTLLTAVINIVSATLGPELEYDRNNIDLIGFSGASPTNLNPAVRVFAAADTTPSVLRGRIFQTDTGSVTITGFDDGYPGQRITVFSKGAATFDTTSSNLSGSSADIVTASGDLTEWVCDDGTVWVLAQFTDVSANNSTGA